MYHWSDMNHAHYLAAFSEHQARKGIDVSFHPFTYGVETVNLAALNDDTQPLIVEGDADFILFLTSANDTTNDWRVRLRHGSSGRELQNRQLQLANIFGTGAQPFYWYHPLYLQRRSTLLVDIRNDTGTARTLRLAFHGVKVFSTRHRAAA